MILKSRMDYNSTGGASPGTTIKSPWSGSMTPLFNMSNDFPSIPEQARNLSKTALDIAKSFAKTRRLLVSDDLIDLRNSICESCDRYEFESSRCRECGCFMVNKVRFNGATCPLNHW